MESFSDLRTEDTYLPSYSVQAGQSILINKKNPIYTMRILQHSFDTYRNKKKNYIFLAGLLLLPFTRLQVIQPSHRNHDVTSNLLILPIVRCTLIV